MATELSLFATTPLGKQIRATRSHWEKIVETKHPSLRGKEEKVKRALENPFEIRGSKSDESVYLYYLDLEDKYLCVVVKNLNDKGFVITAYFTERIKEGRQIWKK